MGRQKLTIKDLTVISFQSDVARSLALNIMNRHFKHTPNEEKVKLIAQVLEQPEEYVDHATLGILAQKLVSKTIEDDFYTVYQLEDEHKHFDIFGNKHIEINAVKQMELAMRLPIAVKGALMPDAHQGYGLPIGGVLA